MVDSESPKKKPAASQATEETSESSSGSYSSSSYTSTSSSSYSSSYTSSESGSVSSSSQSSSASSASSASLSGSVTGSETKSVATSALDASSPPSTISERRNTAVEQKMSGHRSETDLKTLAAAKDEPSRKTDKNDNLMEPKKDFSSSALDELGSTDANPRHRRLSIFGRARSRASILLKGDSKKGDDQSDVSSHGTQKKQKEEEEAKRREEEKKRKEEEKKKKEEEETKRKEEEKKKKEEEKRKKAEEAKKKDEDKKKKDEDKKAKEIGKKQKDDEKKGREEEKMKENEKKAKEVERKKKDDEKKRKDIKLKKEDGEKKEKKEDDIKKKGVEEKGKEERKEKSVRGEKGAGSPPRQLQSPPLFPKQPRSRQLNPTITASKLATFVRRPNASHVSREELEQFASGGEDQRRIAELYMNSTGKKMRTTTLRYIHSHDAAEARKMTEAEVQSRLETPEASIAELKARATPMMLGVLAMRIADKNFCEEFVDKGGQLILFSILNSSAKGSDRESQSLREASLRTILCSIRNEKGIDAFTKDKHALYDVVSCLQNKSDSKDEPKIFASEILIIVATCHAEFVVKGLEHAAKNESKFSVLVNLLTKYTSEKLWLRVLSLINTLIEFYPLTSRTEIFAELAQLDFKALIAKIKDSKAAVLVPEIGLQIMKFENNEASDKAITEDKINRQLREYQIDPSNLQTIFTAIHKAIRSGSVNQYFKDLLLDLFMLVVDGEPNEASWKEIVEAAHSTVMNNSDSDGDSEVSGNGGARGSSGNIKQAPLLSQRTNKKLLRTDSVNFIRMRQDAPVARPVLPTSHKNKFGTIRPSKSSRHLQLSSPLRSSDGNLREELDKLKADYETAEQKLSLMTMKCAALSKQLEKANAAAKQVSAGADAANAASPSSKQSSLEASSDKGLQSSSPENNQSTPSATIQSALETPDSQVMPEVPVAPPPPPAPPAPEMMSSSADVPVAPPAPPAPPVPGTVAPGTTISTFGPPPPPPGGPCAVQSTEVSRFIKKMPKTKLKLRKLMWDKLPDNKVASTFFGKLSEDDFKGIELPDDDLVKEFEEKQRSPKDGVAEDSKSESANQEILVSDPKLSQRVGIILGGKIFKNMSYEEIYQRVRSFDLEETEARGLLTCYPSTEDIKKLNEAVEKDKIALGKVDSFLYGFSKVKNAKERLNILISDCTFDSRLSELTKKVASCVSSIEFLNSSESLKKLLKVVLIWCNYLNSGSIRGNASGFKLSSLGKLKNTRAPQNPKHSVLNLIARAAKASGLDPEKLFKEMNILGEAVRTEGVEDDIASLQRELALSKTELEKLSAALEKEKRENDQDDDLDKEIKSVDAFLFKVKGREDQVGDQKVMYEKFGENFESFKTFYGETSGPRPSFLDVFGVLLQFSRDFTEANAQNEREEMLEKKKREIEEKKKRAQEAALANAAKLSSALAAGATSASQSSQKQQQHGGTDFTEQILDDVFTGNISRRRPRRPRMPRQDEEDELIFDLS